MNLHECTFKVLMNLRDCYVHSAVVSQLFNWQDQLSCSHRITTKEWEHKEVSILRFFSSCCLTEGFGPWFRASISVVSGAMKRKVPITSQLLNVSSFTKSLPHTRTHRSILSTLMPNLPQASPQSVNHHF